MKINRFISTQKIHCLFFTVLFILGCSSGNINQEIDMCLIPSVTVAYPYEVEHDYSDFIIQKEFSSVLVPQLTSEQIYELSKQQDPAFYHSSASDIEAYGNEIWYGSGNYIFSYNVNLRSLTSYQLPNKLYLEDLLIDSRGGIWTSVYGTSGSPLLYFDRNKESFIHFKSSSEIFNLESKNSIDSYMRGSAIIEYTEQKLWFLLNGRVWVIDIENKETTLALSEENNILVFGIASENKDSIWLVAKKENAQIPAIYLYDIAKDKLDIIANIPGWLGKDFTLDSHALAADNKGTLWISNYGWIELLPEPKDMGSYLLRGIPYRIIENPVFVAGTVQSTYGYATAQKVTIISDNEIWFSSSAGIIQLDVDRGEWCLLAKNINVAVAKDGNGSIWFADEQLYKLPLGEQ